VGHLLTQIARAVILQMQSGMQSMEQAFFALTNALNCVYGTTNFLMIAGRNGPILEDPARKPENRF
ncbi:MAG: hypothetical protein ACREIP_13770, partial [Alphaproteobacteria bacterium]